MIYDLIVIGGGPAGYLGALRASGAGLKTLLIEKKFIGGVCLNEGCIPSKALLNAGKIYDDARFGEAQGIKVEGISLDHGKVLQRKKRVVTILTAGVKAQLKKNNVKVIDGQGQIESRTQEGYQVSVEGDNFIGKRLLIATGSEPIIPSIAGVEKAIETGNVLTNREILDLKQVPQKLIVIGGGVIGLEMASYFNSAGSKVTVIEMLDHIADNTDREISQILMKNYEKKGVTFRLNSKVIEINNNVVTYEYEGERVTIEADKILLSTGRRPVTQGLGLEKIGVETQRGKVLVDDTGQTNIPGVYAAGDVNGHSMLAHTAYREAEVCINNLMGNKDIMRYNAIPSVIYTNPEVAGVGETEESARQKGIDFEVSNISMRFSGKYLVESDTGDGICKVLVDKKYGKVIGLHMIANGASEIIYGAALMIEGEMRVKDIKELVFPHPTVSEIIRESIFNIV